MAELTFPIVDQPMAAPQWSAVTLGMGSGILSTGGDPYGLASRDNIANTVTLRVGAATRTYPSGVAQAIVAGFYHRLESATTVPVPAVTKATTYYVGLTYREADQATRPVSLTCTTTIPTGAGVTYLPLYEISRSANQLLTDAQVLDRRVYVSPMLTAESQTSLPSAASMLTGTLCLARDTGTIWRASSGTWEPANAPWFVDPQYTGGWAWDIFSGGIQVQYKKDGKRLARADNVYFRRTDPAFTVGKAWQHLGVFIPPDLRKGGNFDLHGIAMLSNAAGIWLGMYRLNLESGSFKFRLSTGTQTIAPSDAILFSAAWSTW